MQGWPWRDGHGAGFWPFATVARRFFTIRVEFFIAGAAEFVNLEGPMSDGVTVAQGPLEAFVMVRIHVGQPILPRKEGEMRLSAQIPSKIRVKMKLRPGK